MHEAQIPMAGTWLDLSSSYNIVTTLDLAPLWDSELEKIHSYDPAPTP